MNTNKQKNYLVIKNVCLDKNLVSYLEQICQGEHVNIVYEEFNQFNVWNGKQSIYASFDATPSSDMILWSYDSIKLEYINYLYKDFEARYRNTGKVVSRIIESVNGKENLDESEKLDIAIRDDLSSRWNNNNAYTFAVNFDYTKPTFKQKISKFYNKHSEKMIYFGIGFVTCDIILLFLVLTLK